MSYGFRLGRSTVSEIVTETSKVLWDVLQPLVLPKPTTEQLFKVAEDFTNLWQFPHCCDAVDGKHCVIKPPGEILCNYFVIFWSHVSFSICNVFIAGNAGSQYYNYNVDTHLKKYSSSSPSISCVNKLWNCPCLFLFANMGLTHHLFLFWFSIILRLLRTSNNSNSK